MMTGIFLTERMIGETGRMVKDFSRSRQSRLYPPSQKTTGFARGAPWGEVLRKIDYCLNSVKHSQFK